MTADPEEFFILPLAPLARAHEALITAMADAWRAGEVTDEELHEFLAETRHDLERLTDGAVPL